MSHADISALTVAMTICPAVNWLQPTSMFGLSLDPKAEMLASIFIE